MSEQEFDTQLAYYTEAGPWTVECLYMLGRLAINQEQHNLLMNSVAKTLQNFNVSELAKFFNSLKIVSEFQTIYGTLFLTNKVDLTNVTVDKMHIFASHISTVDLGTQVMLKCDIPYRETQFKMLILETMKNTDKVFRK